MTQKRNIRIALRCPKAPCGGRVRAGIDRAGRIDAVCPRCREPIALTVPDELIESGKVEKCAACPGREFFIRKDFPQRIGLLLVIIFGLIATWFFYQRDIIASFATLVTLVVIDALIFLFVGKVTVCYRCRAEYRGFVYNPDHEGFDLATSEKYG